MDSQPSSPNTQPAGEKKPGGAFSIAIILAVSWELIKIILIAALIVIPIRYFIFQPFVVKGDSMVPNFHSGDYLIVDEFSYRFSAPRRGDVVVLKYPVDMTQRFVKRIIGLPGETVDIANGKVAITDMEGKTFILNESEYLPSSQATITNVRMVKLGQGEYFVMGDNRPFSYDSRVWGVLSEDKIVGRALFRLFPLWQMKYLLKPAYQY